MTPEEHNAAILEAEATAAAGIERDLDGLRGVHGDVIAFIERRWMDWMDRTVARIETEYYRGLGLDD